MKKRVTIDVDLFPGNSKGLEAGSRVLITVLGEDRYGTIERIFEYPAYNRHEAEILCDNGKRNFKTEDKITKV